MKVPRRRDAHRLKFVAKVDLCSQDLEKDHHLLIDALAVLCHKRQYLHWGMLSPLIACTGTIQA